MRSACSRIKATSFASGKPQARGPSLRRGYAPGASACRAYQPVLLLARAYSGYPDGSPHGMGLAGQGWPRQFSCPDPPTLPVQSPATWPSRSGSLCEREQLVGNIGWLASTGTASSKENKTPPQALNLTSPVI